MSKIGQQIINIPTGVNVTIESNKIVVKGPKGELSVVISKDLDIKIEPDSISLSPKKDSKIVRSIWGTTRVLISNSITGVTEGFKKQLELVGTGYRSEVQGNTLVLTVGYSHPIKIEAPENISFKVEKGVITVEGIDKQVVGQVSADVRSSRPPEPYKGKGVKYVGEFVRRKAGKAAKAAA